MSVLKLGFANGHRLVVEFGERFWMMRGCLARLSPMRSGGGMPTVLRSGPYRFYFYGHEPNEPPHVHVDRDDQSAKFWLEPIGLARNLGFSPPKPRRIERLVQERQHELLETWNDWFGNPAG